MRVLLMALVVTVSVGMTSAFAENTCIVDAHDNCVTGTFQSVSTDSVVRLGVAGGDHSYLSSLMNSYQKQTDGEVVIVKPHRQNAVQENKTVGRPYDVLISYHKGEIRRELMKNGFADWVFNVKVTGAAGNCGFASITIPYQNKNRAAAVEFISYVLDRQKKDCACDVVFEGNIEKLDTPLLEYVQTVASL